MVADSSRMTRFLQSLCSCGEYDQAAGTFEDAGAANEAADEQAGDVNATSFDLADECL